MSIAYDPFEEGCHMTITHRYITKDEAGRLQRQAALHRKCLLLLRTKAEQTSSPAPRKAN